MKLALRITFALWITLTLVIAYIVYPRYHPSEATESAQTSISPSEHIQTPEPTNEAQNHLQTVEKLIPCNPGDIAALNKPVSRYKDVIDNMTIEDWRLVEEIVAIESRGEPYIGQIAVAEVIFNRCLYPGFPYTPRDVIFDRRYCQQFTSTDSLGTVTPTETQHRAVMQAVYGPHILDEDVVYFSAKGENSKVFMTLGKHVFCYG